MIPQDVVEDILRQVSIVQLISQHVTLKKAGHNYKGLCPFHNDKNNPSLSVSEEKGLYHCFSCGAGGNALTFVKEYEKLDFIDAIKSLGQMVGIDVDEYVNANQDLLPLRNRLKLIHQVAQEYFVTQLYNYKDPGAKLAVNTIRSRKLDKNTIELFKIGYGGMAWDGLFKKLLEQGFKADEIILSGLCGKTEQGKFYDRFRNRIIFPVSDSDGTIIAFGGRALDPQAPAKYINSPETPLFKKGHVLYAWDLAKETVSESGEIIIAEGYMDVIRMFQAGFRNAVAPLGTGLTEDRISFLKNKTDRVIFCFDGDDAGQKSAFRSSGIAAKIGVNALVTKLPPSEDPDTFILTNGPNKFAELISSSVESETFVLDTATKYLPDTQQFLQTIFEYVVNLEGLGASSTLSIATEQLLRHIAEVILVSYSSVELEFRKFKEFYVRNGGAGQSFEQQNTVNKKNIEDQSAYDILAILIMFPELLDHVAEIVIPSDFPTEEMQEFYKQFLFHPERTTNEWVLFAGNTPFIEETGKFLEMPDIRVIKNHAVRIRINSLKKQRDILSKKIIQLEQQNTQDTETSKQILEIQSEIISLTQEFYYL